MAPKYLPPANLTCPVARWFHSCPPPPFPIVFQGGGGGGSHLYSSIWRAWSLAGIVVANQISYSSFSSFYLYCWYYQCRLLLPTSSYKQKEREDHMNTPINYRRLIDTFSICNYNQHILSHVFRWQNSKKGKRLLPVASYRQGESKFPNHYLPYFVRVVRTVDWWPEKNI